MAEKNFSYKKSIEEIEKIISEIESKEVDLDELTKKVQRAAELLNQCKNSLLKTEDEVVKILDSIKS